MTRVISVNTKFGVKDIPFDKAFPNQDEKKYVVVGFSNIKEFIPEIKHDDVISIAVMDI